MRLTQSFRETGLTARNLIKRNNLVFETWQYIAMRIALPLRNFYVIY